MLVGGFAKRSFAARWFQVQTKLKYEELECFSWDVKTISNIVHAHQISRVRANSLIVVQPSVLICDPDNPVVNYQGCVTMNLNG